ncbi:unnamed protein product [Owenia fusiformis]|uniref:Uncharacterized protein n=1 Tax=Owenia fusiformis TaxID=6347 RepID=A0A8S4Q1S1_OWEFU|nr:unnamed protein product [Owenia fusiformis]
MSSSDGDFLEPVVKRKRKTPRRTRRRSEVLKTTSTAKKGDGRTVQSINQRSSPDLTTTTRPNQWSNTSLNEGNSGALLPPADLNAGSQDNPLKIDSSSEDEFKTTKAIVNTKKGCNKTSTLKGSKPKHSSGNTTYNKPKAIEKTTTHKTAPRLSIWNLSDPSSSEVEGPARPTNEHDDTTGPGLTGKSDKQPRSPNKDVLWTIIESRVPSLHGDEMDQRDFQDDEHNGNFNEGLTTNVHDESPVNSKMISNLVTEANIIYKDPRTQGASKDKERGLLPFKNKLKAIKTKSINTSSLSEKENCSEKNAPATMNVSKIKGIDIENASQSHVKDIKVENGIVKYKNLSLKTLTIPLTSVIMGDTESLYCNPTNIQIQEANDTMTSVGGQNSAMEELDHNAIVIPESSEPEDSDAPGESVKVLEQKRRLSLQSVDLFDSDPQPTKPSIKSIGGKKRNSTSSEHTCDSDATIKSADLMKLKMTNDETKKDISEQYSDLLQDIDFDMELSQSQSIISSQNPKPKPVTKQNLKVKPVISSSFLKISGKPVNANEGQSPKYVIPGVKWKATTMTKRDFSSSSSDSPDDDGTTASLLKDIRDRKDKLDHVKDDHNIDSNTGHQIHHAINKTGKESKTSKAKSFRKHKSESGTEDQEVYNISCGLDLSEESVKNTENSDSDVSPSKEMLEDSEDDIPLHELSKLKQNKKVKKRQVSGKNDDSDLDSDIWLCKVSPPKAQSSPRRKLKKKQKIASVKPLRSQEKKVQASKPLFSSFSDEDSFDIIPRQAQTTRNKKRPDYFFDTSTTDVSFNDDNRKNESTFKKDKDNSKHKSSKKALSRTFEETVVTEEKVESEKEDNVGKEEAAKPKFLLFPILNSTKLNPSKRATTKKEVFKTEKINRSVDNNIKRTSDEEEVNLICLDSDDNENKTMHADNETSLMEIKSDTEKKSNTKKLHMEKKPSNKTFRMEKKSDNENMEIKSRNEKKSDTEKIHMEKKPSNKTSCMEKISDNENMEIKSRNEKKSDTEKLHMEKKLGNKISHMEKKSDNEDVYDSKNPQTETSSVKTDSKKLLISKKSKLKLGEIIKFVTLTPEKDKIISKEKGDNKSDVSENESTNKQEVEDKQLVNIDHKDPHEQDDLADHMQENPNTLDENINIHDDLSLSDEDDIGDDGNIFDMSMEHINEDENKDGIEENDSDNTLNLTQRMKDFENNACGSNNLTDDNVTDIQDIFRSFFTVENSSPEKIRKVEAVQEASEVPPNNNGKTMKTISTGTMKNLTSDEQNHTDRKLKSKNKIKQKTRKENEKNDNNKKHPKSVKKRKRDQKKHKSETQESGQKGLTSDIDLKEKTSEKSTPPEEKNIDNVASRSCSPTMFSDGDDDSVHNNLTQIIQGLNSQENSPGRTMVKSQVDKSLSKVVNAVNCQEQEVTDKMSRVLETPEKSGCDSKKLEISSRESSINNVSIEIGNHLITHDITRLELKDSHERKSLETSAIEKSTADTSFDTIEDPISVTRLRHVSASTPIKKFNLTLNDPDITVIENLPSHNISAIEQETTIDNVEDNLCNTKPVEPKVNTNKERDENGEETILLNDTNIVKKECVDDWIGYSQVEAPIVLSDSDADETTDILTNLSQKPSMFIIEDEEDESDDNDDIFEEMHVTASQKSPEYVYIDSSDDDVHTVDHVIEKGKCENEQGDARGIKTEDELKDPNQNDLNTQSLLEDLDDVLLSLTQQVRQSTDEEDASEADASHDEIDIGEMSKGIDPCFQTEKSTEKFTEKKMNKPSDDQINIGGDLKDTSLDNNMKKDLNMSSDDDLALIASLNDYEDHMIDDDKVQIVEKSSETQRDKSRDKNTNQNHVLSLKDSLPDISAKSCIKDSTTSTKRKEKSGGSSDSDEETFRTLLKKPKISHPVKEPILKNLPSKNRFGSSAKQFQIPKSRHKSEGTKKAVAISPQRLKSKQEIRLSTKFYNKDSNKQSSFNKDTNESWLGKRNESRPSGSLQKSLSYKKHTSIRGKTSLSKHRRSNTSNSTSLTQPIHDAKQAMRERARKVELEKKVPKVIRANPVKTSATSVSRFKSRNLGLVDSMTSPSTINNRVKKPVSKPPSKPPATENRDGKGQEKSEHVVKSKPVPSTSAPHTKGSNAVPRPVDPSHPQGLKSMPPGNLPPAKTPFDTRNTTKELLSKRPQNSINPSRNLHRTHLVGATSRMQKENRPYPPAVPTGQPAAARTPAAPSVQPQENFDMFLSHVIGWNVDWLAQQDRCKDPPPVVDEKKIWPLLDVYESYSDYCELMTSLLLLETWQSIWKDWKEGQSSNGVQNLGITAVFPYTKHIFSFELQSVISEQNNRNQSNIREGDLVVLNYKVGRCNEKVEEKRCFGYVLRAQKFDRRKHKPHHALIEAGKQRGSVLMGYVIQTKKISPRNHDTLLVRAEVVSNVINVMRQVRALNSLSQHVLCPHILKPTHLPIFGERVLTTNKALEEKFNPSQVKAIQWCSHAVLQPNNIPRLCLLQGPPGTGKSHTIVGLIKHILRTKRPSESQPIRILICAPSNGAIDELMRRIIDEVRITKNSKSDVIKLKPVRVGNVNSVHPAIQQYTLDAVTQKHIKSCHASSVPGSVYEGISTLKVKIANLGKSEENYRKAKNTKQANKVQLERNNLLKEKAALDKKVEQILLEQMRRLTPQEENRKREEVLQGANIVASTLNFSGSDSILTTLRGSRLGRKHLDHFTAVIVDEASQTTELDCLVPLMHGCSKLILVGDPEQLPATVVSKKASDHKFGKSLFERLYRHFNDPQLARDNPVLMLDTQYRMHRDINRFPSQHVYNGRLHTDRKIAAKRDAFPFQPYLVFDMTEGQEEQLSGGSTRNKVEGSFVVELCRYILQCKAGKDLKGCHIGIITPYRGQKSFIQDQLNRRRGCEDIEVNTVDAFQGREKEIVIMSCVRAKSNTGTIGFLANRQRMNVALTRAKYALYVVGSLESVAVSEDWEALINDAKHRLKVVEVNTHWDRVFKKCVK